MRPKSIGSAFSSKQDFPLGNLRLLDLPMPPNSRQSTSSTPWPRTRPGRYVQIGCPNTSKQVLLQLGFEQLNCYIRSTI